MIDYRDTVFTEKGVGTGGNAYKPGQNMADHLCQSWQNLLTVFIMFSRFFLLISKV